MSLKNDFASQQNLNFWKVRNEIKKVNYINCCFKSALKIQRSKLIPTEFRLIDLLRLTIIYQQAEKNKNKIKSQLGSD